MKTQFNFVRSWERLLAITCVIAIASGAFAVSSPAVAQTPPRDADLRVLVVDLAAELRLVYRNNVPEFTRRHEQLREAITAWNASPKSAADRQQMTVWLRESIRNSMPGAEKPMPAVPTFDSRPSDAPTTPRKVTVEKPIAPTALNPIVPAETPSPAENEVNWAEHPASGDLPADLRDADPFRDDPPAAATQP